MTTLPFKTDSDVDAAAPRVASHLGAGGLLAYPTETVYGLGSRPVAADVNALSVLKGRPSGKPFLLLVANRTMAERTGLQFSTAATVLSDAFWPGPLTLVLPGGPRLPPELRGPEGGIAVRVTSHRGTSRLITFLDEPITSTSANKPRGPTAPGVAAIETMFAEAIASGRLLVLDGGVLGNVPPSTLVDCTGPVPRIVREGAILRHELAQRVGGLVP